MQIHTRTCNLCEAMCGLEIEVDGDQILAIKGDKNDPFSQGHICPKATALADVYHDPDRLKRPLRRTPTGWEEIGWEEALDEVAQRLHAIQTEHGRDAVGVYLGNPNVHNVGSLLYGPAFTRVLRTKNRFSATSADQLPHHFAARFMFGHQFMIPVPDIDHTDFMLILGANPLTSNGSLMTAPGVKKRLQAIQGRGGQVIVVDPRRTATAKLADRHHFIRPGSDVFLLLGLLQVIFGENLVAPDHLLPLIREGGLEAVAELVAPYTPERVAASTGIPAEEIAALARAFCAAPRAVAYGRIGTSTQAFGGLATWLISVLNIVTGNLDRQGGGMFTLPAIDVVGLTGAIGAVGKHGRWHSRVRGLPEFGSELPVAALAEEMLTPGEGQIRAMLTMAGNPVLSTPNGRQLDSAFEQLDFMVSIDIYLNETTRHADIILPPTTGLETEHYDLAFHALAVRNTSKYSDALYPPSEGARHDYQVLIGLRDRLMALQGKTQRPGERDLFALPPDRLIDILLRFGWYGAWGGKLYKREGNGLSVRELRQHPHGIDLGPLQPQLKQRIFTPDRKIDLAPTEIVADLPRAVQALAAEEAGTALDPALPLRLIGRRQLRSNNSWMHNAQRLVKGKPRCTLLMHPTDAATRHIADGQTVTIQSPVGSLTIDVEVTADIMPGVVSIPHGWGHDREGIQLGVAEAHAGVSINDLTDDQAIDALTGNAAFSGVPVEVLA